MNDDSARCNNKNHLNIPGDTIVVLREKDTLYSSYYNIAREPSRVEEEMNLNVVFSLV